MLVISTYWESINLLSFQNRDFWILDSYQNWLIFNQKNHNRPPIDPASPFAQSVMMRKIARRGRQAIFVNGVGRNLYPCASVKGRTAFPMVFAQKSSMGALSYEKITYPE
jgi:hypothetical protein